MIKKYSAFFILKIAVFGFANSKNLLVILMAECLFPVK